MKKVAVIYYSQTDTTAKLAQAVKSVLQNASDKIEIIEHSIVGEEIEAGQFTNLALLEKVSECDAVLFGSPTYMGMVSGAFKSFCDSTGLI